MPLVLLLLATLFLDGTPVSTPHDAPAARSRTQPQLAFSGDRYLAVWLDSRDCDNYQQTIYGERFDRFGNSLDPKGFVILPCGQMLGYGTPQVFAEPDGWSVSVPQNDALSIIRVSQEGTIGLTRSVAVPLLFQPVVTRSENGWLIHNALGDKPAIVTDLSLRILGTFNTPLFGFAVDDASDGSDFISVRLRSDYNATRRTIEADFIGGDGTMKRANVVIRDVALNVRITGLSVVWTGADYVVAWIEDNVLMVVHVSRDGTTIGAPVIVASGLPSTAKDLSAFQLNRDLTLLSWSTATGSFSTTLGCDSAPFENLSTASFATDGTNVFRIRTQPVVFGQELRRNDLYAAIAPIGCGPLRWSSERLVSLATVAQELPAVAGDAIAWIDVQTDALRGVRLDANGAIAGELRFPPHESPRDVRLAAHDDIRFAAWNDGGVLKAGRVVDAGSAEPRANRIASVGTYTQSFDVTWSGSEFLVIYTAIGGIRAARFDANGEPISTLASRHRVSRVTLQAGDLVVPQSPAYPAAMSAPRVAWSGSEGLMVWQVGFPCSIIPECLPPRPYMIRIDTHGHPLDAARPVVNGDLGQQPDVVWTGTEYLVAWSNATVHVRRFARDAAPLDATFVDTGIAATEAPLSLAMLGARPLIVIARNDSIEGYTLDSMLHVERVPIADTTGSNRTYASAATFNGDVLVAYHRSISDEIYGGSTRVFYKLLKR